MTVSGREKIGFVERHAVEHPGHVAFGQQEWQRSIYPAGPVIGYRIVGPVRQVKRLRMHGSIRAAGPALPHQSVQLVQEVGQGRGNGNGVARGNGQSSLDGGYLQRSVFLQASVRPLQLQRGLELEAAALGAQGYFFVDAKVADRQDGRGEVPVRGVAHQGGAQVDGQGILKEQVASIVQQARVDGAKAPVRDTRLVFHPFNAEG